jgi:hypothetical protein
MRTTSLEAYEKIKRDGLLCRSRWQVYDVLFRFGPMTQAEVVAKLREENGDVNKPSITPRFAELEIRKVVHVVERRHCRVTGETCQVYDVTDYLPEQPATPTNRRETIMAEVRRLRLEVESLRTKLARWGRPTDEARKRRQTDGAENEMELFAV